jgi:mono/diheme cytochrome c family protein
MYTNYCSGCHGIDGRGKGSFSASLKQTPPNLTVLSRNNGGVYPEQHVIGVIAYGPSGHGGAGMPTWSSTLSSMDWGSGSKLETRLRISNLSKYVQTLQAK